MSQGKFCPNVNYFSYEASANKGKHQPDSINGGQSQVKKLSGSQPAIKLAKGSAGALPGGVHKHSGTESYTKVQHKAANHGGPRKAAGASATPEGVRKFGDNVRKK